MITRLDKTMLSTPELKDGQIISLFAHLACKQAFLGLLEFGEGETGKVGISRRVPFLILSPPTPGRACLQASPMI